MGKMDLQMLSVMMVLSLRGNSILCGVFVLLPH